MHKGFILLNCDLGAEEFIVDQLKQMSIISNAYLTFGAYDVIAEIETEDQQGFEKVVATIRKLSRVVSTMTLNVINTDDQIKKIIVKISFVIKFFLQF